jgi:DNA-binding NtrC family response regulator
MAEQPNATVETSELEIKSILLLDDDIELADTLKHLLESHNFIVTTVKNGVEGLHEIMRLDFDVIMCDILMPQMAGDMFYIAVQRTKPHLCDRFIFITGHADNPKVTEFLSKTNALALYKPVNSEDLVRSISFVLKKTSDTEKRAAHGE